MENVRNYSQYEIAKLCGETSATIGRLTGRAFVRPTVPVGVRLLFTSEDKDRVVKLVEEFRTKKPKKEMGPK